MAGIYQRRAWRSRSGKTGYRTLVCIVIAALLSAFLLWLVPSGRALPVLSGRPGQRQVILPDSLVFFRRLLWQVIPGLEQPDMAEKTSGKQKSESILSQTVNLLDPRDPRRIFSAQIPYLGEISPAVSSTVSYRGSEQGQYGEPRIIIPEQSRPLAAENPVIIYHTHTTESYVPTSGEKFSEDLRLTVAQLGRELGEILEKEYGIPVIHNSEIHDIPRSLAYEKALDTLKNLTEEHANAGMIIDLHRDGVGRRFTTAEINGVTTARIMFVVGSRHAKWTENHRLALFLHETLEEIAPGLSRGIHQEALTYNQHLHPGSLLIEIGGYENSLEEARNALPYLAAALARWYLPE